MSLFVFLFLICAGAFFFPWLLLGVIFLFKLPGLFIDWLCSWSFWSPPAASSSPEELPPRPQN